MEHNRLPSQTCQRQKLGLAYFGSSVATAVESCLDHQHPRPKDREHTVSSIQHTYINGTAQCTNIGLSLFTVKLMFLYSTVSTLNPMVGMVVTISPDKFKNQNILER